jgi:hypothetical protein
MATICYQGPTSLELPRCPCLARHELLHCDVPIRSNQWVLHTANMLDHLHSPSNPDRANHAQLRSASLRRLGHLSCSSEDSSRIELLQKAERFTWISSLVQQRVEKVYIPRELASILRSTASLQTESAGFLFGTLKNGLFSTLGIQYIGHGDGKSVPLFDPATLPPHRRLLLEHLLRDLKNEIPGFKTILFHNHPAPPYKCDEHMAQDPALSGYVDRHARGDYDFLGRFAPSVSAWHGLWWEDGANLSEADVAVHTSAQLLLRSSTYVGDPSLRFVCYDTSQRDTLQSHEFPIIPVSLSLSDRAADHAKHHQIAIEATDRMYDVEERLFCNNPFLIKSVAPNVEMTISWEMLVREIAAGIQDHLDWINDGQCALSKQPTDDSISISKPTTIQRDNLLLAAHCLQRESNALGLTDVLSLPPFFVTPYLADPDPEWHHISGHVFAPAPGSTRAVGEVEGNIQYPTTSRLTANSLTDFFEMWCANHNVLLDTLRARRDVFVALQGLPSPAYKRHQEQLAQGKLPGPPSWLEHRAFSHFGHEDSEHLLVQLYGVTACAFGRTHSSSRNGPCGALLVYDTARNSANICHEDGNAHWHDPEGLWRLRTKLKPELEGSLVTIAGTLLETSRRECLRGVIPIADMLPLPTLDLVDSLERAGPPLEHRWLQITKQRIVARVLDLIKVN